MKKIIYNFIFVLFIAIPTVLVAQETIINSEYIAPNNENIQVYGSNFTKIEGNEMILHRHSDRVYKNKHRDNLFNPLKARTSAGIYIEFKTNSPKITFKFKIVKGNPNYATFNVFQNGKFDKKQGFKYNENTEKEFEIIAKNQKKETLYRIILPITTDIHFLGLEIENNFKLCKLKKDEKPVYVAYGDSITHGIGQKNTSETYAYQLAEKMGYELFNVAVSGARTSIVMAEEIRDSFQKVDVITLLIGYNDYSWKGLSAEDYAKQYIKVLNILREKHKDTKIYCISMTYTTQNISKKSQIPADDFRKVVREIVEKRQNNGDKNIFLVKGEDITTKANLNDKVHFSVDGAKLFAEALYQQIK